MDSRSLLEVARSIATPFYCYDFAAVRAAHARLTEALPVGADLFYSLKANPHPAIVAVLHEIGCRMEITSVGELSAVQQAGVPGSAVLYTGPGKSEDEIACALNAGVRFFAAESWTELERIDRLSALRNVVSDVLLRVNPDEAVAHLGITMVGVASQFGFEEEDLARSWDTVRRLSHVAVRGCQVYYGGQVFESDHLLACFEAGIRAAARLAQRCRFALDYLDLGGGFGAPFAKQGRFADLSGLRERIAAALVAEFAPHPLPHLAFESGRYLVAGSGFLVATVEQVKPSKGKTFAVLDAGINHLGGMSGLGRLPKLDVDLIPLRQQVPGEEISADLVGPLCTPLDCLARGARVPRLSAGDLVAIPNVGAYGLSASLGAFLSRPYPAEVMCDAGKIVAASRAVLVHRPIAIETTDSSGEARAERREAAEHSTSAFEVG